MKKASLSGSLRESVGKKDAKILRDTDRIPAVMYGGEKQVPFSIAKLAMEKLVYNPDVFWINLDVSGEKYNAIIKDIQYHPVTDAIIHVDFLQLFDDKLVSVKLPVRASGNSPGVRNGGRLAVNHRHLTVRGLPGKLPEFIGVDISKLEIGDVARVRDIKTADYDLLQADADVVVAVKRTRAAMAAAAAAAAAK
jgi:large subunit ribosomal protein L25